jgi:hypothetical protein
MKHVVKLFVFIWFLSSLANPVVSRAAEAAQQAVPPAAAPSPIPSPAAQATYPVTAMPASHGLVAEMESGIGPQDRAMTAQPSAGSAPADSTAVETTTLPSTAGEPVSYQRSYLPAVVTGQRNLSMGESQVAARFGLNAQATQTQRSMTTLDLRPFRPDGWDSPLVPSASAGTRVPDTLYAGQPVYLSWAVTNDGSAAVAGRLYNCVYLDDAEIARWYVDDLQPGYYTYAEDWSYVVGTPGWHTLRLTANCAGTADEANGQDNAWEASFYWNSAPAARPDPRSNLRPYQPGLWDGALTPSTLTGTHALNTLYAGQPIYLDWAVSNTGYGAVPGRVYTCVYLDGAEIARWYVDDLKSGNYTHVDDWRYSVGAPGWHTLRLTADCAGTVDETNESDNTWERSFYWNPRPNLRPFHLDDWEAPLVPSPTAGTYVSGTLYTGQPAYIDWMVLNDGAAAVSGRLYNCVALDGVPIAHWRVDDLQPGSYTYAVDWSFTMDAPGWHTLRLTADCTGAVAETDESDNVWEGSFYWRPNPASMPNLQPYQPAGWDGALTLSTLTGTHESNTLYAEQPIYIDWAVANAGGAAASGRAYTCMYLDDALIGRWYVDNLPSGYYIHSDDWGYVVGAPGWHTLRLTADCTSAIDETDESDNSWERSFYWNPAPAP